MKGRPVLAKCAGHGVRLVKGCEMVVILGIAVIEGLPQCLVWNEWLIEATGL